MECGLGFRDLEVGLDVRVPGVGDRIESPSFVLFVRFICAPLVLLNLDLFGIEVGDSVELQLFHQMGLRFGFRLLVLVCKVCLFNHNCYF